MVRVSRRGYWVERPEACPSISGGTGTNRRHDNAGQVNAVRGMTLARRIPLQDRMATLETFETSLGPWGYTDAFANLGRKTRWAVSLREEVKKLRALVAANKIARSFWLLCIARKPNTVYEIKQWALTWTQANPLVNEHSNKARKWQGAVEGYGDQASFRQVQYLVREIEHKADATANMAGTRLDVISVKADAIQTSMVSVRGLAHQVLIYMRSLQGDAGRSASHNQADWRTYQAVLQIQKQTAHSSTSLQASNIQFANALEIVLCCPTSICHWEVRADTLSLLCFTRINIFGQPFE